MGETVFPSAGPLVQPLTPPEPPEPMHREFDDVATTRRMLFDNTLNALKKKYPVSNERYTLQLGDLGYKTKKDFSPDDQKRAIMRGRTLGWNLSGSWKLVDNTTGKVVDQTKRQLVAQVPYMTDRGTFIYNGSEYTVAGQMRLRPGVYSRVKDNGQIEAHFNVKGGTGPSFRVHMEPDSGIFRMNVGQANLKLYPILRAMGYDDRQLLKSWGRDILHANIAAADPRAVQRAYAKLVREPDTSKTMAKAAQDEDANRRRAHFLGTVVCDDSKPSKPWIYLSIHEGLAAASWEALNTEEPAAEKRTSNPHITLVKNDECKKLIEYYGKRKWKSACGNGRKLRFALQNAMVDLNPDGWDDMDRVWFLEVRSPQMRAFRKSLELPDLPQGNDGEQPFHITIGVLPKASDKLPRGESALDALFDTSDDDKAKAAFVRLEGMVKAAESKRKAPNISIGFEFAEHEVEMDTITKLALALDVGDMADDLDETSADLYNIQSQAVNDNDGNPAIIAARKRKAEVQREDESTDTTKPSRARLLLDKFRARRAAPIVDDVKVAYEKLTGQRSLGAGELIKAADDGTQGPKMRTVFEAMELDPTTTEHTLGRRVNNVSPDLIVDVTKKLMAIGTQEAETDDRDALAFQQVLGPEDFFAERISQDAGGLGKRLLWRSTFRGSTKGISPGALSPQLRSVLLKSGLAAPLEEVNPLEIFDQLVRVTRMGEGGMPSSESVPDAARSVQPSHFGLIDPIRAPEGMKIGVDSRVTHRTYKGRDGNLYSDMLDARTGKPMVVSVQDMAKSVVAFPGELKKKGNQIRAMVRGKRLAYVGRDEVDYELPDTSHMFTATSNMVPLVSGTKGGRLLMGAKMATQALPLQDPEAPLVQNSYDDSSDRSFEDVYGERAGAIRAEQRGIVREVGKGHIKVQYADGTTKRHALYNNFPFNRKTYLHNSPAVKAGDTVSKGSLLAKSNYTNNEGSVAVGKNLRVGYMAYRGYNADDAIVISESAAQKLSSEHMYTTKFKQADNHEVGANAHLALFPGRFDKRQMGTIGKNGVVKPGTKLNYGDPIVLAVAKSKPSGRGVIRGRKPVYKDVSVTWDHEAPGAVTDVDKMKGGWKVLSRAFSPMNIGDKLANRYGNKGVVSRIIADDQMPHDKDGKPMEMLFTPFGIISRVNPAQLIETALGKVAKKTGKPYKMPGFMDESYIDFAKKELQKHGMSDTEDLYDPESGRKVPKVFTGQAFIMKLHHMAEKKSSGRDVGAYTSEGIPARGGDEGSKRVGGGEMNALISHGATSVIRDAKVVRGQRNDDYWRALRLGYPPPSPKVPMVYEKFLAHLQGAGINLKKDGDVMNLFALTDRDIDDKTNGAITVSETIKGNNLDPVAGGLFDLVKTGGHGGGKWSHIDLATPIPNPVMEEPIRRLLGITKKTLADIIAGKENVKNRLPGSARTGTEAIFDALKTINITNAITQAEAEMTESTGQKRDAAVKRLGHLRTLKKAGMKPESLMMAKVPVLPPAFRPITAFNKMQLTADPNFLYLDLMNANKDYKDLREELGEEDVGEERLKVYNAFKAVAGLGDPIATKSQQQKAKGLLKHVFGGSPKYGMWQRRVMGAAVDTIGRGVITPNPSLNMDQVGLPESKAWVLYRPFIMRHLVRRGMQATAAAKAIENKLPVARKGLTDAMSKRPVIINRAPVLHKYGMMAAWPVLVKGNTLQVPPMVTSGFNADFDGDAMNYQVPVSDDAVQEATEKMMPSQNLKSVSDFDVHYYPKQEFLFGLNLASTAKKRNLKTFATKEDVLRAYQRGELDVGDQVDFRE